MVFKPSDGGYNHFQLSQNTCKQQPQTPAAPHTATSAQRTRGICLDKKQHSEV